MTVASMSVIEPIPMIDLQYLAERDWLVGRDAVGEVARDGITVNMLLPGVIATDRSLGLSARGRTREILLEEAIKRNGRRYR